jgi:hypothetical protein
MRIRFELPATQGEALAEELSSLEGVEAGSSTPNVLLDGSANAELTEAVVQAVITGVAVETIKMVFQLIRTKIAQRVAISTVEVEDERHSLALMSAVEKSRVLDDAEARAVAVAQKRDAAGT